MRGNNTSLEKFVCLLIVVVGSCLFFLGGGGGELRGLGQYFHGGRFDSHLLATNITTSIEQ